MYLPKLVNLKLSPRQSLLCIRSRLYATKHHHTRNTYYYEVLGIQSSASQTQIKKAYFELSKKHHPDVSESEDSKLKFQLITDAYAVLGSVHSRRMYDRGLISGARQSPPHSHEAEEKPFDPYKVPPKPVKTDLEKAVNKHYKDITINRKSNLKVVENIRKIEERESKDYFTRTNQSMAGLREAGIVIIFISTLVFGLFKFESFVRSENSTDKDSRKK